MITAQILRQKYLDFFKSKGHTIISSASLIPENDPSVLFTTAGMHPLVPYLLGENHPAGTRLANCQKCIRTQDIDEVGDNRHLTFFEMLGNWSLGDYFKKEAIAWSFEFLTSPEWLGLDPKRLYVTVFKGADGVPIDTEAIQIWQTVFNTADITAEVAKDDELIHDQIRIIPLGIDDNFWIAQSTGPCGGDTEMFYDTRPEEGPINTPFSKLVKDFRLIEIWNDVFMEFNKIAPEHYEKLNKQNVDTGMGVERTLTVLLGKENVFETDIFTPYFAVLTNLSGKQYLDNPETTKSFRIIADHIRSAVMIMSDDRGIVPKNVEQGYVLRRLIRRAIRHGKLIDINTNFVCLIAQVAIDYFKDSYPEVARNQDFVLSELAKEEDAFRKTLEHGLKEFEKLLAGFAIAKEKTGLVINTISGKQAFRLYDTYGFPLEMTQELAAEKKLTIDLDGFNKAFEDHQALSRAGAEQKFKGGLADHSIENTRLHTATHLLHQALRTVLGTHVQQKGSNITPERLRFDFSHSDKMTPEQLATAENMVNEQIKADLPVTCVEMTVEEAKQAGALGFFEHKYGEKVKVYTMGRSATDFYSKEMCGGPHVEHLGELGSFKILKEEASSAGVRRIKATVSANQS